MFPSRCVVLPHSLARYSARECDTSFSPSKIFGHSHPKDLLSLTRTSKAFRSFFLSRANSGSIWKSSLCRVGGLPERPAFLSEPAFAHLLFDSFCQVRAVLLVRRLHVLRNSPLSQKCGKSGVHDPVWPWFVRYCKDCIINS